jgi:hypothetical protein
MSLTSDLDPALATLLNHGNLRLMEAWVLVGSDAAAGFGGRPRVQALLVTVNLSDGPPAEQTDRSAPAA